MALQNNTLSFLLQDENRPVRSSNKKGPGNEGLVLFEDPSRQLDPLEDGIDDNEDLASPPDIAKYLRITPHNVVNKTKLNQGFSAERYCHGNNDISYTLCYGKKTRFVRGKNHQNHEIILIEFDLVFEYLVSIVRVELDLEEGSVDQSYWREGKLNHKPILLGKNRISYIANPGQMTHKYQLSFSSRSYGTMYVKRFRFKAISYKSKIPSKHTRDLQKMVNCEEYADVWFSVEGKTLCASRFVLSARSEYFHKLLLGNMKEGHKNEVVHIKSTTYHAFSAVILYLYTGILHHIDVDQALQMLCLAHQYLINDLEDELQSYLLCNISIQNSNEILLIAHELELKSLKEYAMGFTLKFVKSFEALTQQPALLLEVAQALATKVPKKVVKDPSSKKKNRH